MYPGAPPLSTSVPVLETERLRLRGHTVADYPVYCELWNEPEVIRYTTMRPSTAEETWSRLLRQAGHWALLDFGWWLVEERATGDVIGEVGIFDNHREIKPAITVPEMGWLFATAHHGQGFATEAVQVLLAWAQKRFAADEIACIVHPENTGSLNVAAKCGFVEYARSTYRDGPIVMLRRKI